MHIQKLETNITAYPEAERAVRETLASAYINVESFKQLLNPCSLSKCYGMCCYDGVYTDNESAEIIEKIAQKESQFFLDIGLDLPIKVIVDGEWQGMVAGKKTAVKYSDFSLQVKDYPPHFNNTACVFLLVDGRCGLQLLSEAKNLHPWYYKPFACWMHPIAISYEENLNCLLLYNNSTDPFLLPEYDGFVTRTFCGKISICGQYAYNILEEELKFLGIIVGRDFLGEIKEYLDNQV